MILLAILSLPLAAVVISLFFGGGRIASWGTFAASAGVLGFALEAAETTLNDSSHTIEAFPGWLAADALSALVLCLIAAVGFAASLFSIGYMRFSSSSSARSYHVGFNLFLFSMLAVPLIQKPTLVWVAVELTTLFSVLLVGFENTGDALEAAWKYVVLTLMGASIALLGFLILYWGAMRGGVVDYTWSGLAADASSMSPALLKAAFIFILVGFGAKIGLVPLHTWLPDAHSQAPTPVCALLSGVETTTVLYVILRLAPITAGCARIHYDAWLTAVGLISVGVAAFLILNVRDYKRLFAFSTVEHMGIILVAVGLGTVGAHKAAMLQTLAHCLTKSLCFYAAGAVLLATGTREISEARGLYRRSPLAGGALFLGGLAIAGAPPFLVFLGEFSILREGFALGRYAVSALLAFFIAVAFFAIMNHVSGMVFGETETDAASDQTPPIPKTCVLAIALTAIPVVLFGIHMPEQVRNLLSLAATALGG